MLLSRAAALASRLQRAPFTLRLNFHASFRPRALFFAGCFFLEKALNAQNAGADAVIIVDNVDEPLLTMTDPALHQVRSHDACCSNSACLCVLFVVAAPCSRC